MAAADSMDVELPKLPAPHADFIKYLSTNSDKSVLDLVKPYNQYDAEMRKIFAQKPDHPAVAEPNVVSIFEGHETDVRIQARNLDAESAKDQEAFIMPLKKADRRADGSPAVVQSLRDFRTNFNVFSESALVDLDWSNVVAAGSSVVTSLLAVPEKHGGSKRALRSYYHEQLAPASDVDLFIYGLTEEQAKEKIKQIEQNIRDAILVETTTIRTKNAITIASQYPTRHVQVVLRIYKSISEILTGFDVDCACAAYDGQQVYASPRALTAYMTQINTIDLTRRSPSYESRLSKYARRGFEVYWPNLDRSRVDPTIFERSFGRTEGLARLLILEKLPKSTDREAYLDQRRAERGRPAVNRWRMRARMIRGNIKNDYEDEVAEWVDEEEVSDYHTFTIPYGPKFHARKIEKLLYTKDLLLNAEWNKPKDREVNLHRHPAFFGRTDDVFHDCCGYCPSPATPEEKEAAEQESKIYVSGGISFIKDDPGRQTIGSFNPLSADDWTEMAYVGNTELLCKAIVDGDIEYVRSWLEQEGNDPNTRDYTGRTPLHLAVTSSTLEVVQTLVDQGARLVARLVDGKTALHLAAMRGNVEMVSALLRKSEANEEEEERKTEARRTARQAEEEGKPLDAALKNVNISQQEDEDSDVEMLSNPDDDDDLDATTENSIVNIKPPVPAADDKALEGDDDDEPDVYDVNVLAWDVAVSPLHLAIVHGHVQVVKTLVQEFGADVLLPVKLVNDHDNSARGAILTLVLALCLQLEHAKEMTKVLIELGASSAQADMNQKTALHFGVAECPDILPSLLEADETGVKRAINHLSVSGAWYRPSTSSPLVAAIQAKDTTTALRCLAIGSKPNIDFVAHAKASEGRPNIFLGSKQNKQAFMQSVQQPILTAVQCELPELALTLIEEHAVDVNTLTPEGYSAVHDQYARGYTQGKSLLDEVQGHIKDLENWKPEVNDIDSPLALQDDSSYLVGLQEGTYSFWSAQKQLSAAKAQYKENLKNYQNQLEAANDQTGVAEKQAAIADLLKKFQQLETKMIENGAKTFKQLHPDVEEPNNKYNHTYPRYKPSKPEPFKVNFRFNRFSAISDEAHERYMKLFEATWRGDLQTVKQLTLLPWKDSDGDDKPPLTIAIQDQHNLSPLAIAVLHGQFELASAIMEIAKAQYVGPDEPPKRRYRLAGGEDDDEESDEEGIGADEVQGVNVYSEIVDEQFTIENIGEVSTQVKSHTPALAMLNWRCPASDFVGGPLRSSPQSGSGFSYFGPRRQFTMAGKRTNTGSLKAPANSLSNEKKKHIGQPSTLIQFALHTNDLDLLIFLLNLGQDHTRANVKPDDEDATRYFQINHHDYMEAIKLDRPHLLVEVIKRTGAGLPLNRLVKKSGVEVKQKPKYYQGLSVYGKKRKDWADAGRNEMNYQAMENHQPGLLEAAHWQSLETVEWFLGEGPMRCYLEFADVNKKDKRVKLLSETKLGFEGSVTRFLNARSKTAIHCSLLGKPVPESIKMLRFLISNMHNAIDAKSAEGLSPLHIAFGFYRQEAAKMLIEAGALQTCRDNEGNNILHHLFRLHADTETKIKKLEAMLDLIDKRVLPTLFLERSSGHPGSQTPLAQWVHSAPSNQRRDQVLRMILDYSKGAELSFINGEGHTPLHVAVRQEDIIVIKTILEHDPTLLLRENAIGRTPFDMAEDAVAGPHVKDAPPLPGNYRFNERRARKYDLRHDWYSTLTSQNTRGFAKREANEDRRTLHEKIWDLFREVRDDLAQKGQAKRRLVTLNEANEVARRLTASKSGMINSRRSYRRRRHDGEEWGEEEDDEGQDEVVDEVQLWLPYSGSYVE
ncbi:hypothetical protein PRZ48_006114 [Zasmidium cellare]|uniref:Ankyrin repeat protein n=1 Tax=Zasmidium cellare TaxID=395010 RepID=A0ABR0EPF4_ZASCE|nr:hypothetical protein PRZ48_006114 [Zasmidium cellare]